MAMPPITVRRVSFKACLPNTHMSFTTYIVPNDRSHKRAKSEHGVHSSVDYAMRVARWRHGRYMRGMKVKDADILFVPGYTNSGPDHWQTRWQSKLSTARRVEQAEWSKPVREDWTQRWSKAVNEAERPVVIVAHSLGVADRHPGHPAVQEACRRRVLRGSAGCRQPVDPAEASDDFRPLPARSAAFPVDRDRQPQRSLQRFEVAEDTAAAWGSLFIDAGESGHINAESGHGPWPEGSLTFAKFLSA